MSLSFQLNEDEQKQLTERCGLEPVNTRFRTFLPLFPTPKFRDSSSQGGYSGATNHCCITKISKRFFFRQLGWGNWFDAVGLPSTHCQLHSHIRVFFLLHVLHIYSNIFILFRVLLHLAGRMSFSCLMLWRWRWMSSMSFPTPLAFVFIKLFRSCTFPFSS